MKKLFLRHKHLNRSENLVSISYRRLELTFDSTDPHFLSNCIQYQEEERLLLVPRERSSAIARGIWLGKRASETEILKCTSNYMERFLKNFCGTSDQYYYFNRNLSDVEYQICDIEDVYDCKIINEENYHKVLKRFWPAYVPLDPISS